MKNIYRTILTIIKLLIELNSYIKQAKVRKNRTIDTSRMITYAPGWRNSSSMCGLTDDQFFYYLRMRTCYANVIHAGRKK